MLWLPSMSLKYADAPPENCVPNTLLDPTPNDGCPSPASRNAVRYGFSLIRRVRRQIRHRLSCRYVDDRAPRAVTVRRQAPPPTSSARGCVVTVSGAIAIRCRPRSDASHRSTTGSPCARSAGNAEMRKPALSNTENSSSPVLTRDRDRRRRRRHAAHAGRRLRDAEHSRRSRSPRDRCP